MSPLDPVARLSPEGILIGQSELWAGWPTLF